MADYREKFIGKQVTNEITKYYHSETYKCVALHKLDPNMILVEADDGWYLDCSNLCKDTVDRDVDPSKKYLWFYAPITEIVADKIVTPEDQYIGRLIKTTLSGDAIYKCVGKLYSQLIVEKDDGWLGKSLMNADVVGSVLDPDKHYWMFPSSSAYMPEPKEVAQYENKETILQWNHGSSKPLLRKGEFKVVEEGGGYTIVGLNADDRMANLGYEKVHEDDDEVWYHKHLDISGKYHRIAIIRTSLKTKDKESSPQVLSSLEEPNYFGFRKTCSISYMVMRALIKKIEEKGWDK